MRTGTGVRDRARLRKWYGWAKWRKVKGVAQVRLPNGRNAWPRFIVMKRTGLVREAGFNLEVQHIDID